MNQETIDFLRELAAKLGTTVEHLWAVLVRQAPIESTVALFQYAAIVAAVWFWVKALRNIEDWDEWHAVVGVISGTVLAIVVVVAFFSIPDTVTGYLNPEYWAFQRVKP